MPPRCIVSADSVVNTPLTDELTFYSGNPADAVREPPETLGFFHRGEAAAAAHGGRADNAWRSMPASRRSSPGRRKARARSIHACRSRSALLPGAHGGCDRSGRRCIWT